MQVHSLEGPSYAGKTTLAAALAKLAGRQVVVVPCYVEFARQTGRDRGMPESVARSVGEQVEAQDFFVELDRHRFEHYVREEPAYQAVVLDRSPHTILAHTLAVARLQAWTERERTVAIDRVLNNPTLTWPNTVVYVDTAQEVIARRHQGAARAQNAIQDFLVTPDFLHHFREYFLPTPQYSSCRLVVVSGDSDERITAARLWTQVFQGALSK